MSSTKSGSCPCSDRQRGVPSPGVRRPDDLQGIPGFWLSILPNRSPAIFVVRARGRVKRQTVNAISEAELPLGTSGSHQPDARPRFGRRVGVANIHRVRHSHVRAAFRLSEADKQCPQAAPVNA